MMHPLEGIAMYLDKHTRPEARVWIPQIAAWEPVYIRGYGDGSLVYQADGGMFYLGYSAARVFRMVAQYYGIDVPQMRRYFVAATRHRQSVPLPIRRRQLTLFPIKTRIPDRRNDGATGYVADALVQRVERAWNSPGGAWIRMHLTSGAVMHLPMSLAAFEERRLRASYFHYYLLANEIL